MTRTRDGRRTDWFLRLQLLALAGAIGTGTFFAARAAVRLDRAGAVARDLAVPTAAVFVAILAVVVLRRRRGVAALVVIVVAAVELQWGAWGFLPASDRKAFYPWDPAYEAVAADVGPGGEYRFLGRDRNTPRFDTAAFLDLKDARTAFPVFKRYQDLWVALDPGVFRINRYNPTFDLLDPRSPVLDAMSVRYLIEPLHRKALEDMRAATIDVTGRRSMPARFRVTVPNRGIRSLIIPMRAEDRTCLDGWVDLRVGGVTARRLLREVDGVRAHFVLPDVGSPGSRITVETSSTSCPAALDAGTIDVRTRKPNAVLRVASVRGWIVYERSSAIPRASLAGSTIEIEDPAQRIRFLSERGKGAPIVVEAGFGSRRLSGGTAELVVDEPDRIVVRTDSAGSGLLVLRDVAAPGWVAFVDGRRTRIITADHAFRAVPVKSGSSRVEFRYDPPTYRSGGRAALGGLLLTVALVAGPWVAGRRRRRASGAEAPPASDAPDDVQ